MHLKVLQTRLEAGRLLEQGVFADMKGEPSANILMSALDKLRESRSHMDALHRKLDELREINRTNAVIPEYAAALRKILRDHPLLDRVSLVDIRFANVARGQRPEENKRPIGRGLNELLANLQQDLTVLSKQLDQTMDAFRDALPVAEKGGFAAMVLSGRAPLPEKIMHSADLMMVYVQFYNRACQATIAADMQVYPKGLEWLKQPSKTWGSK